MWRVLIVIGVLSAASAPAAVADPCLEYERVSLSGTLVRQVYPGPPDYESVTKGDKPIFIWVLLLDRRVCVIDRDPSYPRRYHEREIQLVAEPQQLTQFQTLLGEKVIVNGKLRPGGAWDEKWLLLTEAEVTKGRVLPALR